MLRGSHGEAAGVKTGASFVERSVSEHGNHPDPARFRAAASSVGGLGPSSTDRAEMGRSRRSSRRSHDPVTESGKAGHRAKGGSGK